MQDKQTESKRDRRIYTREFKMNAVRMSELEGRTCVSVAKDLGIDVKNIYRWRHEVRTQGADAFPGRGKSLSHDLPGLEQLQRAMSGEGSAKKADFTEEESDLAEKEEASPETEQQALDYDDQDGHSDECESMLEGPTSQSRELFSRDNQSGSRPVHTVQALKTRIVELEAENRVLNKTLRLLTRQS
jgi:transposase